MSLHSGTERCRRAVWHRESVECGARSPLCSRARLARQRIRVAGAWGQRTAAPAPLAWPARARFLFFSCYVLIFAPKPQPCRAQ